MKKSKKTKKSWLKRQLNKVQLLPWFWKIVISIMVFFLGGSTGTQLFTSPSNWSMFFGFAILMVSLWFLIQMWAPKK